MDSSQRFNASRLSLHIPQIPILNFPPSTSLFTDDDEATVDEFVTRIGSAEDREEAFYDESIPFYFLLRISSSDFTRSQAKSYLLKSLRESHLNLAAELAYVEGSKPSFNGIDMPSLRLPPKGRNNGVGLGKPNSVGERVPISPSPFPVTRSTEESFVDSPSVAAWSYSFAEGNSNEKGEEGRVWIGKEGGDDSNGDWLGIWEFKGEVTFIRSSLSQPKLCLTITLTFRDDPRLEDLLERTSPAEVVEDENEYMVESFDDVNLLDGLDDSATLHLPASRLPLPINSGSVTPPRRTSAPAHRRSLSLSSIGDTPSYPAIRRAYRRILSVRSGLKVKMRTVKCPAGTIGSVYGLGDSNFEGLGLGETLGEGMALCVEVEGNGSEGEGVGFKIQSIEVEVSGAAGTSDVEMKIIDPSNFPIILQSTDQHNFLYSINFTGQQDDSSPFNLVPSISPLPPSIPITAIESPSQRFTAKFDDVRASDLINPSSNIIAKPITPWIRSVGITIRGQPIILENKKIEAGRSLTNGKPAKAQQSSSERNEGILPTIPFASRWNCILDISSFATRAQSRHATFSPIPVDTPSLLPSTAIARFSTLSTPSVRKVKRQENLEAVAGSKRHTISGLATLTAKAVTYAPPPTSIGLQRRSVPNMTTAKEKINFDLPTPGATGPTKRFFSTPVVDESATSSRAATPEISRRDSAPASSVAKRLPSISTGFRSSIASSIITENSSVVTGNILVSIALIPLRSIKLKKSSIFGAEEGGEVETEMIKRSFTRVGLLDVFLVEVFVLNQSNQVKRFTIGIPPSQSVESGEENFAKIVALDQDVRIGPLAPQSCQSIRLRFLAIKPGSHVLEEIKIVDVGNGMETRLKKVLEVVVI